MSSPIILDFVSVGKHVIAKISLHRPHAANALNAETIELFIAALDKVIARQDCRLLTVTGSGKHFCAGADLAWMKAAKDLSYADNLQDAKKLSLLFSKLASLPMPTIACVHGSVFGGACGLVAACDYAVASEDSVFCLSEIKLGLIPAVIYPYLAKKMQVGDLSRLALSGQLFSALEAKDVGLIQVHCAEQNLENTLHKEVNALLAAAPLAQKAFKSLQTSLATLDAQKKQEFCAQTIAQLRTGEEAQKGFSAFFAKQKPEWVCELK